jgi:Family of unknown function (DUF5678)
MSTDDVIPKNLDLSRFVGQWVLICDNKVLANNKNLTKLKKDIDNCKKTPTIAKIPEKDTLIFYNGDYFQICKRT